MLHYFTIRYFDNSIIELHCREGTKKKKNKTDQRESQKDCHSN